MFLPALLLQAAATVPPPIAVAPMISVIQTSIFDTCPKLLNGTLDPKSKVVAENLGLRFKNGVFLYGDDPNKGFIIKVTGSNPKMCVVSFIYREHEQLFDETDNYIISRGYAADPHLEKGDFKLNMYKGASPDMAEFDLSSMVDRGGANFFVRAKQGTQK